MTPRAQLGRLGGALAIVATALLASVTTAFAHPLVDEGRRLYEEAEFTRALDALARAEAASDLALDDVVTLFETRALVHLATGDEDRMTADLRRLIAVAPGHAPGRGTPPDVLRAIEQIRTEGHEPLRVLASTEAAAAGITVVVRVENDWADVVRAVRTVARLRGATEWETVRDAPLLITASGDDVVEYYAEAIGPGGAVLARTGSATEPLRASGPAVVASGGGDEAWPWIVGGAAVLLVAGAIVTAVVLTSSPGTVSTQVEPFTVRF